MLFCGIDPSLVGHALAIVDENDEIVLVRGWTNKKTLVKKYPNWLNFYKIVEQTDEERLKRIHHMADWTADIISEYKDIAAVAIEGYAFSKGSHRATSDLHELGGQIKQDLYHNHHKFRIYAPTTVKKAWTGSGNADKAQMQMACFKETGLDFTKASGSGDGLADALLIAKLVRADFLLRVGHITIKELKPQVRDVLLKGTKSEPLPLKARRFIGE